MFEATRARASGRSAMNVAQNEAVELEFETIESEQMDF
jgi:hypothetical protein